MNAEKTVSQELFRWKGNPPAGAVVSLALQHLVAMIVGLSAALGVGIAQASSSLSAFPAAVTTIFGKSPVVIATILAIVLNLILPKEPKKTAESVKADSVTTAEESGKEAS